MAKFNTSYITKAHKLQLVSQEWYAFLACKILGKPNQMLIYVYVSLLIYEGCEK